MNIEQDYIDLFSLTRKGHMSKYMYMYDQEDFYERILKHEDYYPFRMERDLINQMADNVCEYFQDVREVLELGPGSQTPIMSKTIPFLGALLSKVETTTYTAIDSNLKYTEQCYELVKKTFNNIDVKCLEVDFLKQNALKGIEKNNLSNKKKLIITFGQCIFANNNNSETKTLLNNISYFLNKNDYILFGVDNNEDPSLLEKAYNTELIYQFMLNTMRFLKYKFDLHDFNPEEFTHIYEWDSKEKTVKILLKSTMKQKVHLNEQELLIDNGQEFHIFNSRRPSLKDIEEFLLKENIEIKNIFYSNFDKNNRFSLVLAQKK